ncbi:MAG: 2-oxoacid:acceptor oxidoreductase subunit alpha [Spirochaetes bacterium]|nr:2-oxoacid:acceptor oxidoreductase subunit alpha [Spirochaetota bacterium]
MPFTDEVSIVLAGEAGQGIQSIEKILVALVKNAGYHVYATKEYMSRVRGGVNSTSIRIARYPVRAYIEKMDILVPLTADTTAHLSARRSRDTVVIGEKNAGYPDIIEIPFADIAKECGNTLYANSVAVGLLAGIVKIDSALVEKAIAANFAGKLRPVIDGNVLAAGKGYALAAALADRCSVAILPPDRTTDARALVSGTEAIALGAIAGGCTFACSYPMSPSTGVLTMLAEYSKTIDIIVEQIEDEVGALNMALGASYAGARSMVTTSGGGFALMTEAVSLAGMIETPAVIFIAQRPGPATGLPTRTEQGDLSLVLYAGHGDFPRIILAPGDAEEAFTLTAEAFDLAERYQVPVFILADQYFVDTYYDTAPFDVSRIHSERHIHGTNPEYRRYAFTDTGVSPRGIPGFGDGLVRVDSDEHDESGYITEDLAVRDRMVDKRLKKSKAVLERVVPPVFTGGERYATLLVGWGSTKSVIAEAYARLNDSTIGILHFSQVYPLPESARGYFERAERIVVIENNVTGQFADLLIKTYGTAVTRRVLKSNGLPFSAEEIVRAIGEGA